MKALVALLATALVGMGGVAIYLATKSDGGCSSSRVAALTAVSHETHSTLVAAAGGDFSNGTKITGPTKAALDARKKLQACIA
jgi:hypothetical protein